MAGYPILHFSGKFHFDMPGYNNDPANVATPFDPGRPKAEVLDLCGCDPAHYFEFHFLGATATAITYRDGTAGSPADPALGSPVDLAGFLFDVSPSAICAQLVGWKVSAAGDRLKGTLERCFQGPLHLNVRTLPFNDDTAAAFYRGRIVLGAAPVDPASRLITELAGVTELELGLQLNRYRPLGGANPGTPLEGDLYGYLRPAPAAADATGRRLAGRRLTAHPDLATVPQVNAIFRQGAVDGGFGPAAFLDIEGFYDWQPDSGLVSLHYLNFVPFLGFDYATPAVDAYQVVWTGPGGATELGRFRGEHDEMLRTGGLVTFSAPAGLLDGTGRLEVFALRAGQPPAPLLAEPDHDFVLDGPRGVTLGSGGTATVQAALFRNNRPDAGAVVRLRTQASNRRSPIVARFADATATTDAQGKVSAALDAVDLQAGAETKAFDRYYGNFVYMEVDSPTRLGGVESLEVATRVVQSINSIPDAPSFANDVAPLFSYYVRYFPWLHVTETDGVYDRFLDVADYESVSAAASKIVARLRRADTDSRRMPRSRDFPVNGDKLIQKWIDAGMLP